MADHVKETNNAKINNGVRSDLGTEISFILDSNFSRNGTTNILIKILFSQQTSEWIRLRQKTLEPEHFLSKKELKLLSMFGEIILDQNVR